MDFKLQVPGVIPLIAPFNSPRAFLSRYSLKALVEINRSSQSEDIASLSFLQHNTFMDHKSLLLLKYIDETTAIKTVLKSKNRILKVAPKGHRACLVSKI